MTPEGRSTALLRSRRTRLIPKSDSWLMRTVSWILFWNRSTFMNDFWTTITLPWWRAIYFPARYDLETALKKPSTIVHECEHVDQADGPLEDVDFARWMSNIGFSLAYVLAFLPSFKLAYFRARWEARAYAAGYVDHMFEGTLRHSRAEYAKWVADAVAGRAYAWSWFHGHVMKMFHARVDELIAERGPAVA